ncbi:MAG: aminoacyl-tRNA hydrolase [Patescibacteria group bacterium]|jgi:PTH1 family peptidyl-tRNA hydrolase|nr:aminoacyl-tRNA hydrolase [Patescibacteria group bacterium]
MNNEIVIIVGLGNPGFGYRKNYHNAGYLAVDLLAQKLNFSQFVNSEKNNAMISEMILDKKIILVKPTTFMNLSGIAVKKVVSNFKTVNCRLIVVHDDIDIPLGDVKISQNRGSAGHKGVASIIRELGDKNFYRVRIGILPEKKPSAVDLFVLKNPTPDELPLFQSGIEKSLLFLENEIKDKSRSD